jgi:hypothetical protein
MQEKCELLSVRLVSKATVETTIVLFRTSSLPPCSSELVSQATRVMQQTEAGLPRAQLPGQDWQWEHRTGLKSSRAPVQNVPSMESGLHVALVSPRHPTP